jgi:hypothetical protein
MPRTLARRRLDTMNADQLRKLAARQRTTIARLDRILIDREKSLGHRLEDLRDVVKDRDALAAHLSQAREEIAALRRDCTLYERQGRHVKAIFEAMLQRYVGTKLDTQQFSFPAGAAVPRERDEHA